MAGMSRHALYAGSGGPKSPLSPHMSGTRWSAEMAKFALNPIPAAKDGFAQRLRSLLGDLAAAYVAARQSRITYGAL